MTLIGSLTWLRLEGRLTFLTDSRSIVRVRYLLLPVLIAAGSTLWPLPARAAGLPVAIPSAAAKAVAIPGLRQEGLYNTMPIVVDGVPLIRIAAPVSAPATSLPVDVRAVLIENAISQLLTERTPEGGTIYDPQTFKVDVEKHADGMTLVAKDAKHEAPAPILTVTSIDAQYNKVTTSTLAAQWQSTLHDALVHALEKRQPAQIKRSSNYALLAAGALAVLTIAGILLYALLGRRARRLDATIEERREAMERDRDEGKSVPEAAPRARRRFLALAIRAAGPEQQLQTVRATRSFIVWLLLLLWAVGITWALLLFPQTTTYGQLIARSAISVAFIWIGAGIIDRIATLVIARIANLYAKRGDTSEDRARHLLRAPTITRTLGGFKTVVIVFIALLATLSAINIPVASVVTVGGIVALAVSFAAQNLVRDVLNGMLVIFEDQYVVGDYVMIGDYNGIVENLTVRVVQLRDGRGNLVTIPHSSAVQVVNASRNWSRVDYRVAIDPDADVTKAVRIVSETIVQLSHDRAWRGTILKPLEWIGVEALSKNAVVLRAAIRTAPLRQFEVRREINERVFKALAQEGIALGIDPMGPPAPPPNASPDPI
jgi:small conductance mechanosensitive channel